MPTNIFSTYSTGENRVTASILAVLQSLSLDRIQYILTALLEQPEFELIKFQNQPASGGAGVPDAEIAGNFRILIETKIKANTVDRNQLDRHLDRFNSSTESFQRLLVLTPDDIQPTVIGEINDDRLVWTSFALLDQSINDLLEDERGVVSEREAFLLRELQVMLEREKLVGSTNDVVVVPARGAWPEYLGYSAYVCQPNRTFQNITRIAFYSHGKIHHKVPVIKSVYEDIPLVRDSQDVELGELINRMLDNPDDPREEGESFKFMFLSPPNSSDTITLDAEIPNDMRSKAGRTTAFTQNQRYVTLEKLLKAKTTSELV
jgi:hypothetical protein